MFDPTSGGASVNHGSADLGIPDGTRVSSDVTRYDALNIDLDIFDIVIESCLPGSTAASDAVRLKIRTDKAKAGPVSGDELPKYFGRIGKNDLAYATQKALERVRSRQELAGNAQEIAFAIFVLIQAFILNKICASNGVSTDQTARILLYLIGVFSPASVAIESATWYITNNSQTTTIASFLAVVAFMTFAFRFIRDSHDTSPMKYLSAVFVLCITTFTLSSALGVGIGLAEYYLS